MTTTWRQFRRVDGLIFFVAPSGRVHEMREVFLTVHDLERAATDGHLTREDDVHAGEEAAPRPAPAAPVARKTRAPRRAGPGHLSVVRGGLA